MHLLLGMVWLLLLPWTALPLLSLLLPLFLVVLLLLHAVVLLLLVQLQLQQRL